MRPSSSYFSFRGYVPAVRVVGMRILVVMAAILSLSSVIWAQSPAEPLLLYGFGNQLVNTDSAVYRIDTGQRPNVARVRLQDFHLHYTDFLARIRQNPRSTVFWIKLGLQNRSDSTLELAVACGDLNYIDGWLFADGQHPQQVSTGTLRPPLSGSTLVQQQYNALPFRLAAHRSGVLYIALRQRTRLYVFDGIGIYTPQALEAGFARDYEQDLSSRIFQWLFQSFLLCQLLYVLFQWLIIRRKEYGYYLFYLAVLALYFLSKFETFLGLHILFTPYPLLRVYLAKTLLILPYFLYFRFIRSFLEIPENYPALNRWIIWVERFLLAYMLFDLIFILSTFDQSTQTTIFTIVLLLVFLLATSFIIYMYRRRQVLIYYVISGSLFVAIGNILGQVFTYFQDYHNLYIVKDILIFPQGGVLLEIICFTAGLSYKSRMSEKEKIRSQENLIEQLKANELLQSRMQHIRNKIAQDLHDDIGSTLSSISILSELALQDKSSGQAAEAVSEIKDSSILLMERMDDIVWSINPKNDSLENLLMRIRHFATTLFEARGIDYHIDIQTNIHEIKLPMDYRQHIYLVLKEAINNLVKYARATQAAIRVSFDDRLLELSVEDNGQGFDPAGQYAGNGISGMHRRAGLMQAKLAIRSAPGEGARISLWVDIG